MAFFFVHLLTLLHFLPSLAANDGIALTPPMGWRSWNAFKGNINQEIMEQNMKAMAARTRSVVGRSGKTSLIDLGYGRAGLDDAWQACGAGLKGSFHAADGTPLWNNTTFPNAAAMVSLGHSLGLKVGWYDNNCICGEGRAHLSKAQKAKTVEGDVRFIKEVGFDGLKADGCGGNRDLPRLAQLLNATGRNVLIENCHYYKWPNSSLPAGALPDPRGINRIWPYWKDNVPGGELMCQEHMFRASGDIRNNWNSWFNNLASLAPYQDEQHPISQPGCWAYADMLMVGVDGSDHASDVGLAASAVEWRSHFAAWAINSSPLILSLDMRDEKIMDKLWPFISNLEAIEVNQNWAGHPGRKVAIADSSASIWVKPLTGGRLAVLVVSMSTASSIDVEVDLASIAPSLSCIKKHQCFVYDIWNHSHAGLALANKFPIKALASHDSVFLVVSNSKGNAFESLV